jgi:hypothetical protein
MVGGARERQPGAKERKRCDDTTMYIQGPLYARDGPYTGDNKSLLSLEHRGENAVPASHSHPARTAFASDGCFS